MATEGVTATSVVPTIDCLEPVSLLESSQTGQLLRFLLKFAGPEYKRYIDQLRSRELSLHMLEAKYGIWEATLAKREADFTALTEQVRNELAKESEKIQAETSRLSALSSNTEAHVSELDATLCRVESEITHARAVSATLQMELESIRAHLVTLGQTEVLLTKEITERRVELQTLASQCEKAHGAELRCSEAEHSRHRLEQVCTGLQLSIDEKKQELQGLKAEHKTLREAVGVLRRHHIDALDADKVRGELAHHVRECTLALRDLLDEVKSGMPRQRFDEIRKVLGNQGDHAYSKTLYGVVSAIFEAIGTTGGWTLAQRIESIRRY